MKGLSREAERWLRQAQYDLKSAEWCLEGGYHFSACFWAQQGASKALRAYLYMEGEDQVEVRSVSELLDRCIVYSEAFKAFSEKGGRLDIYYKTSRFPDSLPGGIPAEIITERDSKEALKLAFDLLRLVEARHKEHIPSYEV